MDSQFFHLLAIGAAIFGISIACHIFIKKTKKKPLVCPMRANCDSVIHSAYSKTLGIRNEIVGIIYYLGVILFHLLFLIFPIPYDSQVYFSIYSVSLGAFMFSMYLVGVQGFVLKEWCTWCVFSAIASTIIFIATAFSIDVPMSSVFLVNKNSLVIFHILGVSLGLGGAIITDLFFFKFLKDLRISNEEADTLRTLSNIIWSAIIVLIVTGIGLFWPQSERLLDSGKFLTKIIAVIVLVINGFMLNFLIAPRLVEISFDKDYKDDQKELKHLKHLAFFSGAISITSWVFIFILGSIRNISWPFETLISIYVGLLAVAYLLSRIIEKRLLKG